MGTSPVRTRLTPRRAKVEETHLAAPASQLIAAAKERGFDIAARTPSELRDKILAGHAVILLSEDGLTLLGFGYLSCWEGPAVSYSGIVVHPDLRGLGYGEEIARTLLAVGLEEYPTAVHFLLTTNEGMAAIAKKLGFGRTSLMCTTADEQFWSGCKGCNSFARFNSSPPEEADVLHRTPLPMSCCCTAYVYKPAA